MPLWQRLIVLGVVVLASLLAARLVDVRMRRRRLAPEVETRYRVLRRAVETGIVVVGTLSALLVIPQVRAVGTALLASSAVVALIVGLAAQRTLANFASGLLLAFTQPLRLGDRVVVEGVEGTVEEITLTHTTIRAENNTRLIVPNEKLASDTIRNATIVSRETLAQITVQVPLESDLGVIVEALREEVAAERSGSAFVSHLGERATITLQAWAPSEALAEELEADLRLRAHARLRTLRVWGTA